MKHQPPATAASERERRLSGLSAPRQLLLRLCQVVDYGQILELHIRDREPAFDPAPRLIREIKLDEDCDRRQEFDLQDFALRGEASRLMQQLDRLGDGCVARIDIRAGIPRRLVVQQPLTEEPL